MSRTDESTDTTADRADAGAATDGLAEASGNRPGGVNHPGNTEAVPSLGREQGPLEKNSSGKSGDLVGAGAGVGAGFGGPVTAREIGPDEYAVDGVLLVAAERRLWERAYSSARAAGDGTEVSYESADQAVRKFRLDEKKSDSVAVVEAAPLGQAHLLAVAHMLGLRPVDVSEGVARVSIPPMPADFGPDRVVLVLRSGTSVISYDVTRHQRGELAQIEVEEFNEAARFVLWGMRNGLRLPDPAARVEAAPSVCAACGARAHFQDPRLADPAVAELVRSAAE